MRKNKNANKMASIEDTLTRVKVKLVANYPFFAMLMLNLQLEPSVEVPTMATDGHRILFNPDFTASLSGAELAFILLHETMHCALGHLWRKGDRDSELWNIATDLVINDMLEKECVNQTNRSITASCPVAIPMKDGERFGLFDPKYLGWSAERVYKDLMDELTDSGDGGKNDNDDGNDNGDSGENGDDSNRAGHIRRLLKKMKQKAIDSHELWNKLSQSEKDKIANEWQQKIATAMATAKAAGNMPGGIVDQLEKILKPQKDWKQLLHEFIEQENFDFSWNPPDRRFPDSDFFLPDFNEKIDIVKDMYFFIDASGSMSNKDITKCASEIQGAVYQFANHLHGKLAYFDTEVYKFYDFDEIDGNIAKTRPEGRGGTYFQVCFDAVKEQPDDVAGIVILTDGECDFPPESEANGIPVLWIFTTPDVKAPYGRYTTLE